MQCDAATRRRLDQEIATACDQLDAMVEPASVEAATRGLRQKIADRARQRARELEG